MHFLEKNGAVKSTLMNMLAGGTLTSGDIMVMEINIDSAKSSFFRMIRSTLRVRNAICLGFCFGRCLKIWLGGRSYAKS